MVKAFQQGIDPREPSIAGHSATRLREISRQLQLKIGEQSRGMYKKR